MRADDGAPVVIRNAPFRATARRCRRATGSSTATSTGASPRLEADGGVRAAEAAVDPDALAAAHVRYAAERDAAIPAAHAGPRAVRRRRRHPPGRQVPARALRVLARGRRRSGRRAGSRPGSTRRRSATLPDGPSEPAVSRRLAAVDIGTNSTRLLVADVDGHDPADARLAHVDRRMRITRLGQGVERDAPARSPTRSNARSPCCASTGRRSTSTASRRCGRPRRARRATRRTATTSSVPPPTVLGAEPELLSGEEEARALVPRRDRRAHRRACALPRRRHRRRLDRVRRRHRASRKA